MLNRKLSISNILSSYDKDLVNLKTFIQESSKESERIYNEIGGRGGKPTEVLHDNLKAKKEMAGRDGLLRMSG
ncbi:hypothetical protein [Pseudomonas phage vB_PaS-HSN4]|nr:hypothetical protein [Pseudomonas phage vB_PaS-HSN4]